MRGLLALPQNVHDLIAIVKPCFAVPSLLLFFVTKFTKKPAPMRRFADAVSVDTASHALHRTSRENATVFVGATERSRGWLLSCRGATPVAPDRAHAADFMRKADIFAGAAERPRG